MNEFDIGQVAFRVVVNAQIEMYIWKLLIISYSTVVSSAFKRTNMGITHMLVATPRSQILSF